MLVATHSGPFHADDVFAFAMLRTFLDPEARIVRTRDLAVIAQADIAIDVGGEFDPSRLRFDHHQKSYEGDRSSAGMVLDYLIAQQRMSQTLADRLRSEWVAHIDAVDTGALTPDPTQPSFGAMVSALGERAEDNAGFDTAYLEAVDMAEKVLAGLVAAEQKTEAARAAVKAGMEAAVARGSRIIRLDRHYKWKRVYFELGGAEHPTDYLLFPDGDSARIVAIPPSRDSFAQKRPLPESWAGLVDEALSKVVGVPGCRFCHKNRFIAVFDSLETAEAAIARFNLDDGV